MRHYTSEGRRMYEDENHGMFSKKLAEWAISKMRVKGEGGEMTALTPVSYEEYRKEMETQGVEIPEPFDYTGWYLYNMALADYPKTLKDSAQRASFVSETILDPDGHPENVLRCFEAKMEEDGTPIHWEKYL